ncbi:NAD(P)-dependent oxidoreductase [Chitinophaga sancti]|uniref:3-hydroxyisobutyrate dehydrogenase n=1 Tax=Chitinophaga sancti TaxID=1004 RepID=A0A1K1SFV2_9BACT|nr:NAD(P)-dependent oxidoreductase [Chitinophaga sancti]WQD59826.1 NAD(P)-dependent oxidoreductase [Chitinophaga sancti]WQG88043.1 NAD(P)-dependent oxidoreductase [Chitinophaga sancti]SFW83146.1 3-hydroxyisobutyrate dehydrogenase [Chitinophaga sancti]
MKIGWAGLGNMGRPMVRNLVKAGFEVTVYNRTVAKADEFAKETGVKVAGTPAELVTGVDCVITMVSDDAALQEIWGQFLAAPIPAGLLAIDMSTVSPDTTKAMAARVGEKGIAYLDAPVSGSVKPAEDKQLVILVGGQQADFERAKPVFDSLGKSATLLGPSGAGNYAKLAINAFLGITVQGLAEAVIFARKHGIGPDQLLPLINESAVGSGITKVKTAGIVNGNYAAAFALKLLAKDIRLAREQGLDTPAGVTLSEVLNGAVKEGLGDEDMIAILKYLE